MSPIRPSAVTRARARALAQGRLPFGMNGLAEAAKRFGS